MFDFAIATRPGEENRFALGRKLPACISAGLFQGGVLVGEVRGEASEVAAQQPVALPAPCAFAEHVRKCELRDSRHRPSIARPQATSKDSSFATHGSRPEVRTVDGFGSCFGYGLSTYLAIPSNLASTPLTSIGLGLTADLG